MVALAGSLAQLINTSLGMAFGIISTTTLVALSYSAPMASSIVHFAEIGTSASNAYFHFRNGNVDKKVFLLLGLSGGIGAFLGALLLSWISLNASKPLTAALLLGLGILLVVRFVRGGEDRPTKNPLKRFLLPLGFTAGLIDANAGGGWGTIVTSSLQSSEVLTPSKAIGTSSSARLTVAIFGSLGFAIGLGLERIDWIAVIALAAGGLVVSPFAAKIVARANQKIIGLLTGMLVIELSIRQILVSLNFDSVVVVLVMLVVASIIFIIALTHFTRARRAKN